MKNRKLLILILLLSLFYNKVYAEDVCSKSGYTILTVNGIFTDDAGALLNKTKLQINLPPFYNGQPLTVDYAYNPTHGAGAGDIWDVAKQGIIDPNSEDYDLVEILNSASKKVTTQKLLLVGHSQGNFYANAFYDKVADKDGGVPSSSLGVYSVATPDKRVAGGGKYLTSDTDTIIAKYVRYFKNIMPPNTHIDLKPEDGNGHDFAKVYLEYKSAEIVRDIKSSLDKLATNTTQSADSLCISPQKLSVMHKIGGALLAVVDPTTEVFWKGVVGSYNASAYVLDGAQNVGLAIGKSVNGLLANAIGSLSENISTVVNPNEAKTEDNSVASNSTVIDKTNEATKDTAPEVISDITPTPTGEEDTKNEILETTIPNNPDIPNTSNSNSNNSSGGGGGGTPEEEKEKDADIVAPVVTIIGDINLEITKDSVYTDAGATALDDVDGDLTSTIVKGGTFVDTATLGTYTITYTVKDIANNSTVATRTINVVSPDLVIDKDTTLTAGEYNYNNLLVTNNAKLLLDSDPNSANTFKGVKITAKNITVDSGSYIYADGKGYDALKGPGASADVEIGASYGGKSLRGLDSSIYGSAIMPLDLGSGGFTKGGGAIYLDVKNILTNNGIVSSNGDVTGSGGSIYVKTKKLTGSGVFSANGGAIHAAGYFTSPGGGGRIAFYYENLSFTGKAESLGGCGSYDGYSRVCADNGTVGFFDTLNNNLLVNSSWLFQKNDSPFNFNKITFKNKAIVQTAQNIKLKANSLLMDEGSTFTLISENHNIEIPNITLDQGSTLILSKFADLTLGDIFIKNNSIITTKKGEEINFSLNNLNIDKTSNINANAKGLVVYTGSPNINSPYAGANYGGYGGGDQAFSVIYGNENEPTDMGSGGNGYFPIGGGAIKITISNNFTNNGIVSTDGNNTSSGGSIYIITNILEGTGSFNADGGGSYCPNVCFGPGGGGRIAIHYKTLSFPKENALSLGWNGFGGTSTNGTVKWVDRNIVVLDPVILSSSKEITSFNFESLDPKVLGTVNDTDHTVNLTVPYGTDIKTLIPTIVISAKASINPANLLAQDFTNTLTYIVTAEDNSLQSYLVSVTVSPNPNPDPPVLPEDTGDPTISSYTLNGGSVDITINPLVNNVSMIFHSNKKVNWMSIKLENESDARLYKIFYSGNSCVDGTNICTKVWNGVLSGGGLLHNGNYKIKVHIKDVDNREYFEYLPSRIIVNL